MTLLKDQEIHFARTISDLVYCNPFLPERIELEKKALGEEHVQTENVWSIHSRRGKKNENLERIDRRVSELAESLRHRLMEKSRPAEKDLQLYEDFIIYLLYSRYRHRFQDVMDANLEQKSPPRKIGFYGELLRDARHFLEIPGLHLPALDELPHIFASYFQIRRAFHHIFSYIVGSSMAVARLRAAVWQSVFSHDLRRYRRILYRKMGDITTLITGPSGTGKELVARAIGHSRYIPFDPETQSFTEDFAGSFYPLNLSALSPTLIESELFGHRRGAFTGALQDRAGWLEVCKPLGTVFLDEIGDVDPSIQVKLLRVIETRTFQRLGDTETRHFRGKIIAATNRDLSVEMQKGDFRQDFYYRLCSDRIITPSLSEQLRESPEQLRKMILFITTRITGEDEAESLSSEVEEWIEAHLGRGYSWLGNFRELEQCVRNVLIRKEYHPPQVRAAGCREELAEVVCAGGLTADELLRRYCTLVYAQTSNYEETARRLGLDRRTIKSKIDPELLERFRNSG